MSGSFFHVLLSCACNLYFVNRRRRRYWAFCFSRFQNSVSSIRNISVSFVWYSPNIYNILLVTFSKLYHCLQEDTEKFANRISFVSKNTNFYRFINESKTMQSNVVALILQVINMCCRKYFSKTFFTIRLSRIVSNHVLPPQLLHISHSNYILP